VTPDVQENVVAFPPTVQDEPGATLELRYMHRRRVSKADHNGDPLDGIVNLWDVALVLAVAFLLAALTGLGLSGILAGENMTIVKNPGEPDMQIITKQGSSIETYDLQSGQQASGSGTMIGQFYRLADGTTIYVPVGGTMPGGVTPLPTTSPGAYPPGTYPTPTPSGVYPTPTPSGVNTTPYPGTTVTPPADVPPTEPGKKQGGTPPPF